MRCLGRDVRLQPAERNLVPVEEAAEIRAGGVAAAAEHDGAVCGWRRRACGKPFRSRKPVVRKRRDAFPDEWKPRDELLVVVELELEHARRLGRAEASRVEHPEGDRELTDHAAGEPFADDLDDAIRDAQDLEASREDT